MNKNMKNWLIMASVVPAMGLSQVTLAQNAERVVAAAEEVETDVDEVETDVVDFLMQVAPSDAAVAEAAMAKEMMDQMDEDGNFVLEEGVDVLSEQDVEATTSAVMAGSLPLQNPGFETGGLSPWTVYVPVGGSAQVVTTHPCTPAYGPMGGEYFLELKTDGPGSYTTAAQFIYLKRGETIGGWAAFDSPDYLPYKDNAKVALYFLKNGTAITYLPWEREVDGTYPGNDECGPWEEWGFEAQESGLYALTYRVTNAKDGVGDSYALFDMGECAGQMCDLAYMGTNGADILIGSNKADVICGLGGNDIIFGMGGNDLICGGAGHDELFGQRGRDTIYGGLGDDEIYGGKQNDKIYGEEGNDELYGGKGKDQIYGGYAGMSGGSPTSDDPDQVVIKKESDELYGGQGSDYLEGDGGDATILVVDPEKDVIDGGSQNDECHEDGDVKFGCE